MHALLFTVDRRRCAIRLADVSEVVSAVETPVAGTTTGEARLAGQVWSWTQEVAKTGDRDITRIDIAVRGADGATVLAALAGFKGPRR